MTRNVLRKLVALIAVFVALVPFASAASACDMPQMTMSSGTGVLAGCAMSAGDGSDVCMVRCPSAAPAFVAASDYSAEQFAAAPAGALGVPAAVAVTAYLAPPAGVLPTLSLNLLYRNFRN